MKILQTVEMHKRSRDSWCSCSWVQLAICMNEVMPDGSVKNILVENITVSWFPLPTSWRLALKIKNMRRTIRAMFHHRGEIEFV